jgi:hypothetical protein
VVLYLAPWTVVPTLMLISWAWRELVPHRDRNEYHWFKATGYRYGWGPLEDTHVYTGSADDAFRRAIEGEERRISLNPNDSTFFAVEAIKPPGVTYVRESDPWETAGMLDLMVAQRSS